MHLFNQFLLFQGETIDWQQVKESGIEFVIVRLGYRAYGESGALVEDAMFEQNVQGALDAGLEVGVYFFSQAISATEAVEETDFVLEHIHPYQITGPVVYDTEEIKDDTARTDQNTREDFTNFCKVFCDGVKQAGYQPMIYANMKWMAFTLKMVELTNMISGMRIIMNFRSVHMIIRCGSTVRPVRFREFVQA